MFSLNHISRKPIIFLNFFDIPSSHYVANGSITFKNSKSYDKDDNTHLNILIVDDEELCRMALGMSLHSTSHNIIFADGGYPAFSYLRDNANIIDLVILDLMMPDLGGSILANLMKTQSNMQDIPIIISTGSTNENNIELAMNCGSDKLLRKPYTKAELIEAISKFKARNK